jgi:hypothetical protein
MRNSIDERAGMISARLVSAMVATGVIAAGFSTGIPWAGGPPSTVDDAGDDTFGAVGTGVFSDGLVGFSAIGDTGEEASADVISQCQSAGGVDCTADMVTNDNLCIVSVGDAVNRVVAGGAGVTVEAARQDAFQRAAANGTPLHPTSAVAISACPTD